MGETIHIDYANNNNLVCTTPHYVIVHFSINSQVSFPINHASTRYFIFLYLRGSTQLGACLLSILTKTLLERKLLMNICQSNEADLIE